jgi:hypothetical protein
LGEKPSKRNHGPVLSSSSYILGYEGNNFLCHVLPTIMWYLFTGPKWWICLTMDCMSPKLWAKVNLHKVILSSICYTNRKVTYTALFDSQSCLNVTDKQNLHSLARLRLWSWFRIDIGPVKNVRGDLWRNKLFTCQGDWRDTSKENSRASFNFRFIV